MRRTLMSWAAATVFTLRAAVSITACTSNGRLASATVAGARVYAGNGFSEGGGGESSRWAWFTAPGGTLLPARRLASRA